MPLCVGSPQTRRHENTQDCRAGASSQKKRREVSGKRKPKQKQDDCQAYQAHGVSPANR